MRVRSGRLVIVGLILVLVLVLFVFGFFLLRFFVFRVFVPTDFFVQRGGCGGCGVELCQRFPTTVEGFGEKGFGYLLAFLAAFALRFR